MSIYNRWECKLIENNDRCEVRLLLYIFKPKTTLTMQFFNRKVIHKKVVLESTNRIEVCRSKKVPRLVPAENGKRAIFNYNYKKSILHNYSLQYKMQVISNHIMYSIGNAISRFGHVVFHTHRAVYLYLRQITP